MKREEEKRVGRDSWEERERRRQRGKNKGYRKVWMRRYCWKKWKKNCVGDREGLEGCKGEKL